MITEAEILDALSSTANDHDPVKAIRALLAVAYDEGWNYRNTASSRLGVIRPDNPYEPVPEAKELCNNRGPRIGDIRW